MTSRYNVEIPPPPGPSRYVSDADIDKVIDPRLPATDRAIIREKLLLLPPSWRGAGLIYTSLSGNLYASNLDLIQMVRAKQREFHPAIESSALARSPSAIGFTNACPMQSLGGQGTGPFRRVYIGCDGYNTQTINFDDGINATNGCHISDTQKPTTDFHNILAGAYLTNGSGSGIDAGLVYINGGSPAWEPFVKYGSNFTPGANYGCNGEFQITLQLQAGTGGENDFFLATSFTDSSGHGHTDPSIMQGVPSSSFPTSGSGFVFRRLFGIAQKPENDTSGEWFGFDGNASGGPNRSMPEILFTATTVSGGLHGPTQVQFNYNTNAYGERSPAVYNQKTDVICSEGPTPPWEPSNFDTYEGINLANANASGTMPGTACAVGQ